MDKQEITTSSNTLRLTIELDLDSRTVPSFGTVRRDGMKGARDIELSLQELGIDTDKAIHPEASAEVLSMYAEEIVDQAFDAIHDLSMDIDATPTEC